MNDLLIPTASARSSQEAPATRRHLTTITPDANGLVTCDVLVMGSGMGGSTFVHGLKDKGLDVVIVERGDQLPREFDNWSVERVFGDGRYRNAEPWLDQHGNTFDPGVFYYVGGNTKLYGAMLPRFREQDFASIRHWDGESPAWPIGYADLEPYYARAETLYRVHGNRDQDPCDPWRSGDYPWPGLSHDTALERLETKLRHAGLKPFVMPAAVDYGPGRDCVLCPTCDGFPCLVDAKGDAEVNALRPALATGQVRLMVRSRIERLACSNDGKQVTAAIGERDGQPIRIEAKRFVLACGAVNSAALLLKSPSEQHPQGLGNGSGQVGRNYMVHNSTFMLAVDPRRTNSVRFQKTLALNDWYLASAEQPYPLGNVQMLGKIREPMVSAMRPWLPKFVSRYLTDHSIDLYLTTEDLPRPSNRIEYDQDAQRIRVHWEPNNLKPHQDLVKRMTKLLRRCGYPLVLSERMGIATNSHQCGTAVMGHDPATSVVDPDGKMHELDNVWIADSSVFCSSAAVNPALTIAANALRIADRFPDADKASTSRVETDTLSNQHFAR